MKSPLCLLAIVTLCSLLSMGCGKADPAQAATTGPVALCELCGHVEDGPKCCDDCDTCKKCGKHVGSQGCCQ